MLCVFARACAFRQSVDGAHNARMGFEFMKHAQQNPEMMQDVMKDLQDPEAMAKVQEMMQVGFLSEPKPYILNPKP